MLQGTTDGGAPATGHRAVPFAALFGAVLPQLWFRSTSLIAAGESFPSLRGLDGVTRFWGEEVTGAGSTAVPSARLLERGIVEIVDACGGPSWVAQRLWWSLVFAVLAGAVAWMAAGFLRRPSSAFAAALVALLSPFTVVTVPNLQPAIAIGALAFLLGILVRLAQRRHVPAALGVALAVWAAPLARTPGLLFLLVAVGAAGFLVLLLGDFEWDLIRMIGTILAGSLFWAVPLTLHHLWGTPGIDRVVDMSNDAVRAVQAHGGPLDVISLVASPLLGEARGGAALVRLASSPWWWMRWALPGAALVGGLLTWRRRSTRFVAVAVVLLVGLASGANTPFRPVWSFFRDFSDAYEMFRSPMSKFGTLLVLCIAVLVASGLEECTDRWSRRAETPDDAQPMPALLTLLAIALAVSHPLFSGEVVASAHGTYPSSRIEVPDGWRRAAAAIDALPGDGAVLVLPLPERELRGTDWGYWGVDDLVNRLVDRTALQTLPGARAVPRGASGELMAAAEQALANGDAVALGGAMRALGATHLAIRTDVVPDVGPPQRFRDGAELAAAADRMGLTSAGRFDQVELFEVQGTERFGVATDRIGVLASDPNGTDAATAVAASLLGPDTVIVDEGGRVGTAWVPTPSQQVLSVGLEPGTYTARAVARGPALWRATTEDRGLSLVPADRAEVDGAGLLDTTPLELRSNRRPFALLVGNDPTSGAAHTLVPLSDVTDVQLAAGAPLTVLTLAPSTVDFTGGTARRCDTASGAPGDTLPLDDPSSVDGDGDRVTVRAADGPTCVSEAVRPPSPLDGHRRWVLDVSWRTDDHASALWCLWSEALGGCVPGSAGGSDGQREGDLETIVDAPGDVGDLQLVLTAVPGDPTVPGAVSFRDVALSPMQAAGATVTVPSPLGPPPQIDAVAGRNVVIDAGGQLGNLASALNDGVVDCRAGDPGTPELDGELLPEGDGVRLAADSHAACTSAPITSMPGIREVVLSFEYQTGHDGVAEIRVVDAATGDVVTSQDLRASSFWTPVSMPVRLPPVPVGVVQDLRVEVLANGPAPGSRARLLDASYRRLTVTPVQPFGFAVLPSDPSGASDPSSESSSGAAGGDTTAPATVRTIDDRFAALRADGDVVLSFQQAYDARWSLSGLPKGATAEHVRVAGWANGWVIRGLDGRSAVVQAEFRGEDLVALLVWTAPALWFVALLLTDWGRFRRGSKVPDHE